MLADVTTDNLAMLSAAVGQDVLNEVVSKLIAGDYPHVSIAIRSLCDALLTIDQGHAGTIRAAFADALQVPVQEVGVTNLQTLLNHLRSILIHAVLGSESKDVVDGTAAISGSAMLADVLDAPVAKLAVSNNIDTSENFVNAGTLGQVSGIQAGREHAFEVPCPPPDSFRRCSGRPSCLSHQERLRATCREVLR